MPVMVLAAGLGTRLRPLTDECPKPLVPIGDRPAIEHVLERVAGLGPIVVNAHHFAGALERALAGRGIAVSKETALLGTAGGVAFAAPLLGPGPVLVWNADVLAPLDARAIMRAHDAGGADATLVVRPRAKGEGNVGLTRDGRIVRLRREVLAHESEHRGGEFLGIHVIGEALRARLPSAGCLVGDVYIPEAKNGARLVAFETDVSFVDVGTLAAYLEANLAFCEMRGDSSWVRGHVDENVRIASGVIVGEGARVVGEGTIERVVVWPGATARAPLANAVVTPARVVHVDDVG